MVEGKNWVSKLKRARGNPLNNVESVNDAALIDIMVTQDESIIQALKNVGKGDDVWQELQELVKEPVTVDDVGQELQEPVAEPVKEPDVHEVRDHPVLNDDEGDECGLNAGDVEVSVPIHLMGVGKEGLLRG
ncbi:hypothetical protein LXL04_033589 [Taraxacum kok-saghyz]